MRLTTIEAEGTKRTQVTRCDANLPGFAKAVSFFDIPGKPPPKAGAMLHLRSHRKLPGGVIWAGVGWCRNTWAGGWQPIV
ncbi:MAG TPA: hypothetical protein VL361_09065 [Candidatus Limnocylindrales bacterium]|nr:hypothetical protein [Candidatus Limnocylindrales bacterium]